MTRLTLTIKRRYFDAIACGKKRVEYRAVKPHWTPRIVGRHYDEILFRNGYTFEASALRIEYRGWTIVERKGRKYYALHLGNILGIQLAQPKQTKGKNQ